MKKIKTHFFNGLRYNICFGKLDSVSDVNATPRDMVICTTPNTRNELITIIHEGMHCSEWNKSEKVVDRTSKDIGRLGFRRR